jgi:hypothetical protein
MSADMTGVEGGSRMVSLPRRRANVEERNAGSELVLYDPAGGRLHVLNETAAAVWRMCDGSLPAPLLAGRLSSEFEVKHDQDPVADVQRLLSSMFEAGLIEDVAGAAPVARGAEPPRT